MGNYTDFEEDFVMRTMMLIDQYYNEIVPNKPFSEQFNYTLLMNCLLGVIVMPKERVLTAIPTDRLTAELKKRMGFVNSRLPGANTTLREFVIKLRHSVAHFDIAVESKDENNMFDVVNFKDTGNGEIFASLLSNEIHSFLQFYTDCLQRNMQHLRG